MNTIENKRTRYGFEPDYAVSPSETLKEVMKSLSMKQKELSVRTGLSEQTIIRILKGEQPITFETANKLELVTGVPSRIWNNLEMCYREQLCRIAEEEKLEQGKKWLQTLPVSALISRGVLKNEQNPVPLVRSALQFYGVASVEAWSAVWDNPQAAAKRPRCFETDIGSASAWIRMGERWAKEIVCAEYDRTRFADALQKIREMIVQTQDDCVNEMISLCADSGVAISFVPSLPKVPWYGASKWLSPQKAMILLNPRGHSEDSFWFTFFHQGYHILHGEKKRLYITESRNSDRENQKAERFAAECLLPQAEAEVI